MKPRLLDLFCGAGGCAKGYQQAGFYVVGVDINAQPHYCGDEFIQADALNPPVSYDEFDAIHASPPCQFYASLSKGKHWRSIPPTRELLERAGLPYVIENIAAAAWDMRQPVQLCGSAFGLGVRRHRLFETNFPVMSPGCAHGQQRRQFEVYQRGEWYLSPVAHVWGVGGGKAKDRWGEAMGVDWMAAAELKEAIPPAMTEHIGHYLMTEVKRRERLAA